MLFVIMLNVVMLSVTLLNVVLLSVVALLLRVAILSVIIVNAVAPLSRFKNLYCLKIAFLSNGVLSFFINKGSLDNQFYLYLIFFWL
jgi:hypothetical protein